MTKLTVVYGGVEFNKHFTHQSFLCKMFPGVGPEGSLPGWLLELSR